MKIIISLFAILCLLHNTTAQQQGKFSIRVMTYNIHHANPPSKPGFIDIDAIARVITESKPDLVALQEVDVHTGRSGSGIDQAKVIAEKTGMQVYFAKAIDHDGGDYGVAILSRFPISDGKTYALPRVQGSNAEKRVLATVNVQLPGNNHILFACTHLDAERPDSNRIVQSTEIVRLLSAQTIPVVLAGDINAEAGSPVLNILETAFRRSCEKNCGFTIPVEAPSKTIDFIFYARQRICKVEEHKVIPEKYASDHLPVLAVFNF